MSWDTQAWAGKVKPGSSSEKLVLLGLAQCADANHCAHPSVDWLCDFGDLNRKTVIAAIARLEEKTFISDTGRRVGKTGQVKVYRLAADAAGDPASATVPKPVQYRKRNSSAFSPKQSQKRDTEPVLEPKPLSSPDGEDAPPGKLEDGSEGEERPAEDKPKVERGHCLPDDWTAPGIDDLPPMARDLARQWPAGAYQAVAEMFRLHWRTETRAIGRKKDWVAALGKWVIGEHGKVMRDAARGVSFAPVAPPMAVRKPRNFKPVPSAALEDQRSAAMRIELEKALGQSVMAEWFASSALLIVAPIITVVSRSDWARSWCDQHYGRVILAAAAKVTKGAVQTIRWTVETPKSSKQGDSNGSGEEQANAGA